MNKEDYYIVSFSGGKDSTALTLLLIENKMKVDEVIYCDVGKEFPAMYRHIEKVKTAVEQAGIKFTTLKSDLSFDYYMFEHKPKRRKPEEFRKKYGEVSGYSWADHRNRYCTQLLKIQVINKYLESLEDNYNVIQYVGIAVDEKERAEKQISQKGNKRYPLIEWGLTENDCLDYCYSLGYDWEGLYNIFNRVSCWCCPLKSLEELRNLRKHFPELWEELIDMDERTWRKFRSDYSVKELDMRFDFEESQLSLG